MLETLDCGLLRGISWRMLSWRPNLIHFLSRQWWSLNKDSKVTSNVHFTVAKHLVNFENYSGLYILNRKLIIYIQCITVIKSKFNTVEPHYLKLAIGTHRKLPDWLINWLVFNTTSTISQPFNGIKNIQGFDILRKKYTVKGILNSSSFQWF